jgi:xanthine dehydrogenase accessory factor
MSRGRRVGGVDASTIRRRDRRAADVVADWDAPIDWSAVKDVLDDIERFRRAGKRVAVARVVGLEGSGPRDPGATMVVTADGEVAGSVSGGCVEGAVLTEALAVLDGDGSPRLVSFGYSDDDAFAVGLSCGGTIHVFIEPLEW